MTRLAFPQSRALIFDFDGVLVDTEPLHCKAWQETLKTLGIVFSKQAYDQKYTGLRDKEFLERVFSENGKSLSEDLRSFLFSQKEKRVRQFFVKEIPLISGADALLKSAFQKFPLALVTGSQASLVDFILRRLKWRHFFSIVVTAEDVVHGKPSPDGFLKAFEILCRLKNWEPPLKKEECLIFEDSKAGIEAATRAKIPYVKVEGSLEYLQNF